LRVACGEPLPCRHEELAINGWAMEARLYAESPGNGFLPSTGRLTHLRLPEGIRVDSGVEQGDEVTAHYDPMLAKLIVHAPDRAAAARALADACAQVEVWPVRTNAAFLARAAAHPAFVAGEVDTGFIERHAATLVPPSEPSIAVLAAAARALLLPAGADPWAALTGFRGTTPAEARVAVDVAGQVHVVEPALTRPSLHAGPSEQILFLEGEAWRFGVPVAGAAEAGPVASDGVITAKMPGRVIALPVAQGDAVQAGQTLLVMEAMKMEQALVAPFNGIVVQLAVTVGNHYAEGAVLARIEAGKL
jgi:3-methylcrotonyl-CoA carboxylase alpha subunit